MNQTIWIKHWQGVNGMNRYRIVTDDKTRIVEAKTQIAACNIVLRYGADIKSVTKIKGQAK
jgi:hypothetical protein